MSTRPTDRFVPPMGRDALLPLYDPLTRLLRVPAVHRRLVDQASIEPGTVVLEIGCGTGNLLLAAKRRHPDATALGLDPDPGALAIARRKAGRAGLDVRLTHGYAGELPYDDGSVDRVLSAYMFHHLPLPEKQRALREVHRVLRPGGSLHLVDVGGTPPAENSLLARLGGRGAAGDAVDHGGHLRDNASERVRELMARAGLIGVVELDRGRGPAAPTYYRARRSS